MSDMETTSKPASRWKRRTAIGVVVVATLAGAGALAIAADRHEGGPGFFGPMGGHHGFMQKASGDFMEYRVGKALDAVDATDEQKLKIKAIFEKARDSASGMRGEPGQMRDEIKALLEAPTIDRDAVEVMRKARMQKMEDASKVMTTAMVDAAEVLTPDQRAKLGKEFGGMSGGHHPRW
jgi:periplasmic protein CpxP/Spy